MVTILMAVYNGGSYLKEQLESIRRQTYTQWNLIVRDDGSSDNSIEILSKFAASIDNEVSVYINNPSEGSAKKNFARLIKDADESQYIMFCDQDDIWKEDKIETSMKAMRRLEAKYGNDTPFLVHGDLEVAGRDLDVIAGSMFGFSHIKRHPSLAELVIQNNVTGCTMLINRPLCNGITDIAGMEDVIMHDYIIALYAKVFGKTAFINKPLLSYRQHGSNSVGAKDNNSPMYLLKRLKDGRAAYKEAMLLSYKQTALFAKMYHKTLCNRNMYNEYKFLAQYGALYKKGYLYRIQFYFKNGVWKKGFFRKIVQCIWG